ncbi:MAG: hypothetical protein K0Q65_2044 [Clostridia bacterium]|jgi:hypothetical protein|nr:hypothetical protein [Clostridia bacterium]
MQLEYNILYQPNIREGGRVMRRYSIMVAITGKFDFSYNRDKHARPINIL